MMLDECAQVGPADAPGGRPGVSHEAPEESAKAELAVTVEDAESSTTDADAQFDDGADMMGDAPPAQAYESQSPESAEEGADRLPQSAPMPGATLPPWPDDPRRMRVPAPEHSGWRRDLGRSAILIAMGGVLGVLLTLLVLFVVSGTLSFASRREVRTLGRDLASVRAAQETAQQRADALGARTETLERKVKALEALSGRIDALERELTASQARLDRMAQDLGALRSEMSRALGSLDERLTGVEGDLKVLRERIRRFDSFLTALRDLLVDIQGPAPAGAPTPTR